MATRTAREVITAAFRDTGLVSEDEAITAEQAAQGLDKLNDMMNGFEAEGIQYVHADLTIDTTVNVPDQLVRSLQWVYTAEVAGRFGKVLSAWQQQQIANSRANLQAYYFKVPQAQTDEGILNRRVYGGTLTTILSG